MFTKIIIALLLFFNIQLEKPHPKPDHNGGKPNMEKTVGQDDLWP